MSANTIYLRLDGTLQAWGSHESKFVIRRTMEAPTKSGVIGLLLCALGISRQAARSEWLTKLSALRMGARVDRPGMRWWDYHTVGAKLRMQRASGDRTKGEALLTRREYMCDASFLVALQGEPELIAQLAAALRNPVWTPYLGRKCCPPSLPVFSDRLLPPATHDSLLGALQAVPVDFRTDKEKPTRVTCYLDWRPTHEGDTAPPDALIWYDVPVSLDPPAHAPRFVIQHELTVGPSGEVRLADKALQSFAAPPPRPRADYTQSQYKGVRAQRIDQDRHLCVFCKSFGTTVQHITYRHAGGEERLEELRTLCRLCHDAVTMIEYGCYMGLDRINPEDLRWRAEILETRKQIIACRSQEMRRRKFAAVPEEI